MTFCQRDLDHGNANHVFREAVKLVEVGVPLDCAVGPADFERVDAGARPQADFGPKVVGGAETRSAAYFDNAKVIISPEPEPGADGPFTEVDTEPVVFVALVAVEAVGPQIARVVAANGGIEVEIAILSDQRILR